MNPSRVFVEAKQPLQLSSVFEPKVELVPYDLQGVLGIV
jgi:hypothetical protein